MAPSDEQGTKGGKRLSEEYFMFFFRRLKRKKIGRQFNISKYGSVSSAIEKMKRKHIGRP